MPAKAGLQGVLFCPGHRSLARNAMRARSYRFRRRKALSRTTGETASAPRALSREKIWNAAKPSPVSLRSPPSPAVRERGHDAFSTKLLSRTAGEGGPGPHGSARSAARGQAPGLVGEGLGWETSV